jgi:hypothetical protein
MHVDAVREEAETATTESMLAGLAAAAQDAHMQWAALLTRPAFWLSIAAAPALVTRVAAPHHPTKPNRCTCQSRPTLSFVP